MRVGRGNNTSRKQKHMSLSLSFNNFQLGINLISFVPLPALLDYCDTNPSHNMISSFNMSIGLQNTRSSFKNIITISSFHVEHE